MQYAKETFHTTYDVKKSIFISYVTPYAQFEKLLETLNDEHPKATHIVWAYRYLNEFDQIVENSTDDGEPKGCAGAPTLSVIRGIDLINSALITVRYFGGIKLGTGGMIRGYGAAAKAALEVSELLAYVKRHTYELKTTYSQVGRYEHFCDGLEINYQNRDFGAQDVIWHLKLTSLEIEALEAFTRSLL